MPRTKTHGTTDYLRMFRNVMFATTAGMTYQNACMTLVNTILLHLVLHVKTKLEIRKVNYPLVKYFNNTNNRNLKNLISEVLVMIKNDNESGNYQCADTLFIYFKWRQLYVVVVMWPGAGVVNFIHFLNSFSTFSRAI